MQLYQSNQETGSSVGEKKSDVLETLVEALSHNDAAVRESAARELGKRKEKRAITPLLDVLEDENPAVRMQAAVALSEMGWKAGNDSEQAQFAIASQEFRELASMGQPAVEPLLRLLNDSDFGMRMAAVEVLSQIGGPRVVTSLCDLLKDDNAHLRAVVVQSLSRLKDPQTIAPLCKLVRDPSWEVRSVLLDAFENLKSPQCVDAVMTLIKDPMGDVRLRAAEWLGQMGDQRAITALVIALVDEDAAVCEAAIRNLTILNVDWATTEHAKAATPGLLPALRDERDSVRERAADALRLIGQTRAMNSFLTAQTGTISHSAVPILTSALQSANRDLRHAAAEALGRLGDPAGIEALVGALMDEDHWVREAALYALNLLNWKPANDRQLVLKSVVMQRWETAILFDSVAFEPLMLMLSSEEPEICRSAIAALAQIGDKRAMEPLAFMLRHPQKTVRSAAAQGLRVLGWLPKDARESVAQALEIEDWQTVSQHGAASVAPLISAVKENYENQEFCAAAAQALANIVDGKAAQALLAHTRDGQLAEMVINALSNLVENSSVDIDANDLKAMTTLSNIFQFKYAFDPRYGRNMRSGLQEVDSSRLKKLAAQELARRGIEV